MAWKATRPVAPVVRDGIAHCPAVDCDERLDEPGSVMYRTPTYISLTVRPDGRLEVGDHRDGDPERGTTCARCGQELDESTFEW